MKIKITINILDIAFVIMAILKLLDKINWNWFVILLPLIIKIIVALIVRLLCKKIVEETKQQIKILEKEKKLSKVLDN